MAGCGGRAAGRVRPPWEGACFRPRLRPRLAPAVASAAATATQTAATGTQTDPTRPDPRRGGRPRPSRSTATPMTTTSGPTSEITVIVTVNRRNGQDRAFGERILAIQALSRPTRGKPRWIAKTRRQPQPPPPSRVVEVPPGCGGRAAGRVRPKGLLPPELRPRCVSAVAAATATQTAATATQTADNGMQTADNGTETDPTRPDPRWGGRGRGRAGQPRRR